jgi:hypothetical protein
VPRTKGKKNLAGVAAKGWSEAELLEPELTCTAMSYLQYMETVTDAFIAEKSSEDPYNRRLCENIND